MEAKKGYVYILTNPSFKGDWVKIGKTLNMKERLRTLYNTSMPLPFEPFATMKTVKYNEAEKLVHHYIETFTNLRICDNREFFNVKPEKALEIFKDVAMVIDDAEIFKYEDGNPRQVTSIIKRDKENTEVEKIPVIVEEDIGKKPHRLPFKFEMVGLNVGDMIVFDPLNLSVKVSGNNKVEYEGRQWTLSGFCQTYIPDNMRHKANTYQGPNYFSYNGKTLTDIRLEKEKIVNKC